MLCHSDDDHTRKLRLADNRTNNLSRVQAEEDIMECLNYNFWLTT